MPASRHPGPQDQQAEKRKKWSAPRLRLLMNNRPQNRPLAPLVLEPSGDMPFGDHNVRLLSPKGDWSIITTDVGQEMLWNRALTLAGMLVFCLAGGVILPLRKGAARVQGTGRAVT